ncbi:hypothetical protein BaRGS_00032795 [Batillaria attramentaria]|uniref:Uncharacterized protein n=1 Tax=Batillaria attramentaria TaxID=370345 RepID=A0ABD0JMH8_9CAEN
MHSAFNTAHASPFTVNCHIPPIYCSLSQLDSEHSNTRKRVRSSQTCLSHWPKKPPPLQKNQADFRTRSPDEGIPQTGKGNSTTLSPLLDYLPLARQIMY